MMRFAVGLSVAVALFPAAQAFAQSKCSATGTLGGESIALSHCTVSFDDASRSVALWINEQPIDVAEAKKFALSGYAGDSDPAGKSRTMMLLSFCPGGKDGPPSPAAVKKIELSVNHARSPLLGRQTVIEAPAQFTVEKMSGDLTLGAKLAGRIVVKMTSDGKPYAWQTDFDVQLRADPAAAGLSCQ